jgi:hypothetical protein
MSRRAEGERCEALHKSDLEPWTWRDVARTGITVLIAAVAVALATVAGATGTGDGSASARGARAPTLAIVVRDQTVLRAAPHASAQQQALLWQGDVVEVRGERIDHLQVWDHARERGGFIDASRVRRTSLTADETPELLALVRFVRDTPGSESLGIGFAAAALKSASAEALRGSVGAELFDAIGTMADRLAQRASNGAPAAATPGRVETALAAHLEAVARHGVAFTSFERDGAMRICYDGDAFRRVLANAASDPTERARATLGLTRPECVDPALPASERQRLDVWRADVLDRVDTAKLAPLWKGRVAMRRASTWSAIAFQRARRGEAQAADDAATRAIAELADVARGELADDDVAAWHDAAVRVGASRWAALRAPKSASRNVRVVTSPGEPGQTCVFPRRRQRPRRRRAAREALHLGRRLDGVGGRQPRGQRRRARGPAARGVARAVAVHEAGQGTGRCRCCRRRRPRPRSATPSSPAGSRAENRCSSPASRAAPRG